MIGSVEEISVMPTAPISDPILARLCAALNEMYGERLERIVLFGSRARGDASPDSDYDVAIFLRGMADRWHELRRLAEIETDILYDTGASVHAIPYCEGFWRERTPLMHEVRRDGRDL
jgi:uncharacterized protein